MVVWPQEVAKASLRPKSFRRQYLETKRDREPWLLLNVISKSHSSCLAFAVIVTRKARNDHRQGYIVSPPLGRHSLFPLDSLILFIFVFLWGRIYEKVVVRFLWIGTKNKRSGFEGGQRNWGLYAPLWSFSRWAELKLQMISIVCLVEARKRI